MFNINSWSTRYLRRIYRDIIRVIEHVRREQSSHTLANLWPCTSNTIEMYDRCILTLSSSLYPRRS